MLRAGLQVNENEYVQTGIDAVLLRLLKHEAENVVRLYGAVPK